MLFLTASKVKLNTCTDQIHSCSKVSSQYDKLTKRNVWEQGWSCGESTRLRPVWPGFDSHTWVESTSFPGSLCSLGDPENEAGNDPGNEVEVEFVGSLLCAERFFSGYSGFPLSAKINS